MKIDSISNRRVLHARVAAFAAVSLFAIALSVSAVRAQAVSLLGVTDASDASAVVIELTTDAPAEASAFKLDNPPRLVVDLRGAASTPEAAQAAAALTGIDPVLTSVRIGQFSTDTLRIVFDLTRPAPYRVEKIVPGPGVRVIILRTVREATEKATVVPGIVYTRYVRNLDAGPVIYHTLEINPKSKHIRLELAMAQDRLNAVETLTSMSSRKGAIAAINGGYFDMSGGSPIDMLIFGGKMLTKQKRNRAFFGLGAKNRASFIWPKVDVAFKAGARDPMPVLEINRKPQPGGAFILTPEYGPSTGTDASRLEFTVSAGVIAEVYDTGNAPIPPDGFVLSVDAAQPGPAADFAPGEKAKMIISANPDISRILFGVTAGPMLLSAGRPLDPLAEEFTSSSNIISHRNPRTAVCSTKKGKLVFLALEGRSIESAGADIPELEKMMLSLGCVDAMNLDGGGSTEMVVNGQIANNLSGGAERPLANAFMIYYDN